MAAHERNPNAPISVQLSRPYQTQEDIQAQSAAQRGTISETRERQLRQSACTVIYHLTQALQLYVCSRSLLTVVLFV